MLLFKKSLKILHKNSYFNYYENLFNLIITTNNIYNFKKLFINDFIFYRILINQITTK